MNWKGLYRSLTLRQHQEGRDASASLVIDLDPEEARRKKAQRHYRLHVWQIPLHRLIGFSILSVLVLLHNTFIVPPLSWPDFVKITSILILYSLLSWGVLWLGFEKSRRVDLGLVFLGVDIGIWTLVIYFSGGEKSLLFFLMILRTADQASTNFRRVLAFSHLSMACYVLLVGYMILVEERQISWLTESTKILCLYGFNWYILLTVGVAERLRNRTSAAIRKARELIQQLKEQSEQLKEATTKAEAANQAKSEFLATVSHELRTPINGIIGMTELTLSTKLTDEQQDYMALLKQSADAMLTLVNGMLDFAKLETGQLRLHATPFVLRQHLDHTLRSMAEMAHHKGLALSWQVASEMPEVLLGDVEHLRQVLFHLVGNAIKFTEYGGVDVQVTMTFQNASEVGLRIAVTDTGIGISADKQELIFAPFSQADGSATRKYGGMGLGLAVSSWLAKLMGGRIWVESEVGAGSTFHFTARLGWTKDEYAVSGAGPLERTIRDSAGVFRDATRTHPESPVQTALSRATPCFKPQR